MISQLLNHLWQSTLFALAAGLVTLALCNNRARVRYWIWFSASMKFLVPFILLVGVGAHLPPIQTAAQPQSSPAIIVQIAAPILIPVPAEIPARDWTREILLSVWAIGFFAILVVRCRDWRRIRASVGSSLPVPLSSPVEVRSAPGLLEPGVVGVLRPVLLLPEGITDRLTAGQLAAVLAHELCHVKRRDNLFSAMHMACEAIFWFHPLVWWIGARLIDERERACDEEVLQQGNAPQEYAEAIVQVCKLYVESPLVCVSGVTGSDLKKRIEAIMSNRSTLRLNFAQKAALAFTGLAALTIPITLGVLKVPAARAQSLKFESVSIKPCAEEPGVMKGRAYSLAAGTLKTGCMPLADQNSLGLLQRAYARFAGRGAAGWPGIVPIQGGPSWLRSALFEITASAPGNPPQQVMEGPMMQALLEDRFKLKLHWETRDVPVYILTGGSGLKPFHEGSCVAVPATFPPPPLDGGLHYCKVRVGVLPVAIDAEGSSVTEFAHLLTLVLDRPVIDRTGLSGRFDIHLEFAITPETPRFLPGAEMGRFARVGPNARPVLTALQDLGLQVQATTGPREFLVVDHAERPNVD